MQRIICHWTGGRWQPNHIDRAAYHYLIDDAGVVIIGKHPVGANAGPLKPRAGYAAHTGGLNTGSIGVALCAMWGAKESPFAPGPEPITAVQWTALARLVADLCRQYDIAPDRRGVLTHAEVPEVYGVAQPGKWDITWLPGYDGPVDASLIGDRLRRAVTVILDAHRHSLPPIKPMPPPPDVPTVEQPDPPALSLWQRFIAFLWWLFKR